MSDLIANCPRCGSQQITFDVKSDTFRGNNPDWKRHFESFCACRHCGGSVIFRLTDINQTTALHSRGTSPSGVGNGSVNRYFEIVNYVSVKDETKTVAPEHLPDEIREVFEEGATCLAVQCYNAAGTMFRLCVDMATRRLLPEGETEGLNRRTRRDLGLRLPWLFENGKLPIELRPLSDCIREDGNDGAHQGTLGEVDAENLLDFTVALLERLYTEPERLRAAEERRRVRRGEGEA